MPVSGSAEAVALGLALADRLPACLALMEERIQRIDEANPVLPEDFRQRERLTRQFALMLIGRWLVSHEPGSEEEAAWISEQGRVAAAAGPWPINTMSTLDACSAATVSSGAVASG